MERLTRKIDGKREFYIPANKFSRAFLTQGKAVLTGVAVELLADYEDTGYTPLQVRYLAEGCAKLEAENAELRRRCEAALSDLKGDCASCAKKGKNVNVCRKCIDSETYDEYKWRGQEGAEATLKEELK